MLDGHHGLCVLGPRRSLSLPSRFFFVDRRLNHHAFHSASTAVTYCGHTGARIRKKKSGAATSASRAGCRRPCRSWTVSHARPEAAAAYARTWTRFMVADALRPSYSFSGGHREPRQRNGCLTTRDECIARAGNRKSANWAGRHLDRPQVRRRGSLHHPEACCRGDDEAGSVAGCLKHRPLHPPLDGGGDGLQRHRRWGWVHDGHRSRRNDTAPPEAVMALRR